MQRLVHNVRLNVVYPSPIGDIFVRTVGAGFAQTDGRGVWVTTAN